MRLIRSDSVATPAAPRQVARVSASHARQPSSTSTGGTYMASSQPTSSCRASVSDALQCLFAGGPPGDKG